MNAIQRVSVEELRDYCVCPMLYDKKYVLCEKPASRRDTADFDGHSHIVLEAERAVEELTGFYFHRLMDKRQVRYETLYRRWERIWWDNMSGEEIRDCIVPVNRASRVRINSHLIEHLPRFHKTFKKPFCPVAVEKDIELVHRNLLLTSTIQMAYRTPKRKIRIVKFIPARISPGPPTRDLELVAQACSWLDKHDEQSVEVAYYCMMSPREYEPFSVGTIDTRSIPTVHKIMRAFQDKVTVMPIDCKGCEYKCEGIDETILP
jgi:hypothetical protein